MGIIGENMKISQANQLSESLSTMMSVRGKVGFKLAYNKRKIDEELREYLRFKQELFQKYGEEKDGMLQIFKGSDGYQKYLEEIAPIEDEDIKFDFKYFTEAELEDADLTAQQIYFLLENFMEEKV